MVDEEVRRKDFCGFCGTSQHELDEARVRMIQLGAYIFWDDERQTEFVRDEYGWHRGRGTTPRVDRAAQPPSHVDVDSPASHKRSCFRVAQWGPPLASNS